MRDPVRCRARCRGCYVVVAMQRSPVAVPSVVHEYRRLLGDRFGARLLTLRIFGSYARGDADEDSDIDVAVVVRNLTERERTEAIDIALTAWKTDASAGPLSPLVWSELEFEDRVRSERRIARDILSEGVVP